MGTKLLEFSIGRGSGALEGLTQNGRNDTPIFSGIFSFLVYVAHVSVHRIALFGLLKIRFFVRYRIFCQASPLRRRNGDAICTEA